MADVGVGVVPIRADMKQFKADMRGVSSGISKQIGGVGRDLDKLGGKITSGIGKALKIGVAGAIGGLAASVGGGISRLLNIEDAQAKLRGLGHDTATVETVMVNALAAVKGTAFGLDAAATAAAGAIASGVKPGQDLERTLKLVGDTATIAGADFGEMGAIFNKVGAGNRLSMEEVNQLADRGVPIMQWLAESYGVTALEARKMVEEGEVDFARFRDAVEKNIGGAALESGNTTRGAFKNMVAAGSRFGAALAGPIFNEVGGFFEGTIGWIDGLTAKVGPLAEQIGEWLPGAFTRARDVIAPVLERIRDVFATVVGFVDENREAIGKLLAALGPAAGIVAAVAGSVNLLTTAWRLLTLATPIGIVLALVAGFVYAYQNSEEFRTKVNAAVKAVSDFVTPIIEGVIGWVRGLGESTSETSTWLADTWAQIQEIFRAAIEVIGIIISTWVKVIQDLWARFGTHLLTHIETAWNAVRLVIDGVLKVIKGIFDVFAGIFTGDWDRVWSGIKGIFAGVWDVILGVIKYAINAVSLVIGAAMAAISALWSLAWNAIKTLFSDIWNGIVGFVGRQIDRVKFIIAVGIGAVKAGWESAWNAVSGFFGGIWDGIKAKAETGVNAVIGIIRGIIGAVNGVLGFLDLGKIGLPAFIGGTTGRATHGGLQEFHRGGVVGVDGRRTSGTLRPHEQLIKALKGEEVLTSDDPRHIANIGVPDTDWVLPIGGPFDFVGKGLSAAGGFIGDTIDKLRDLITTAARPAVNAALAGVDAATAPFGQFGDMGAGMVRRAATGALTWLSGVDTEAGKQAELGSGDLGGKGAGSGWRALVDIFRRSGLAGMVTSTVRSGGGTSRHNRGLAADFSIGGHGNKGYGNKGLRDIFNAFLPYGSSLAELILAGAPFNIKGGKKVGGYAWGRPGEAGNHWNHVHAASFDNGGTLWPGVNTVFNGTGAPERLRPAAGGDTDQLLIAEVRGVRAELAGLPRSYRLGERAAVAY